MIGQWHCITCGFTCESGLDAFQHRGTEAQHHIKPLTDREAEAQGLVVRFTGIERMQFEEELHAETYLHRPR